MSDLQDKINLALVEKATKIIPENIKKGIQIFNVTGTLESNANIVEGAKLFKTKDEMNSSTGNVEGDLALVYRNQHTFDGIYIYKNNNWELAPTQLTATSDYVYKQSFYGKNGVESGTLGTPDNSFADVNAKVYNEIQTQYDNMTPRILTDNNKFINQSIYCIPVKRDGTPLLNTSKVTNMYGMFDDYKNLTTIPLLDTSNVTNMYRMFANCKNLVTIPQLNTSKVTNMRFIFSGCTNLTTIPELDTSSATDMAWMFGGCTNLSDDSLNNIMQMCINATSYTGPKTLNYIDLTSKQADKCKTLSNYSAFTSAGWTTGY